MNDIAETVEIPYAGEIVDFQFDDFLENIGEIPVDAMDKTQFPRNYWFISQDIKIKIVHNYL